MTGIAVLGLHRGGTSAVAGVLYHLGVFMGDQLLEASKDNPRGYFEDRRFMELHTEIMGGDWKRPVDNFERDIWPEYKDEYTALVREFEEHELWGVKDPRLCYCLPLLQEVVGDGLRVICVFRDPWCARDSLVERGGHTEMEAWIISIEHMAYMLNATIRSPRVLYVEYDLLVDRPIDSVTAIAEFLDVEVKQEAIDFIDPDLRHWDHIEWLTEDEERQRANREPAACCPHCGTYGACTYMNEEHIPRCAKLHGGEE